MTAGYFMKWRTGALLLLCAILLARNAEAQTVDIQLVLAVDVSSSVDWDEYGLQMQGIAEAFRSKEVTDAIQAGAKKRISVALTQWAGIGMQKTVIGWQVISNAEEAAAFATKIEQVPRSFPFGGTAIAGALDHAAALFAKDINFSVRRVIDMSGDGRASVGRPPGPVRDRLVAQGMTINGLPIVNDEPDLEDYYRTHVIGGPGAFTEIARGYDDIARAMAEKLAREIRGAWLGV